MDLDHNLCNIVPRAPIQIMHIVSNEQLKKSIGQYNAEEHSRV